MKRICLFMLALAAIPALATQGLAETVTLPRVRDVDGNKPSAVAVVIVKDDGSSAGAATSSPVGGSVAVAGTYQSVLASNTARKGCLIQNTSAAPLKLFLGAPGGATDAASLQLAAGASFSCAAPGGMVITDQISLTAATASATFVTVSQ